MKIAIAILVACIVLILVLNWWRPRGYSSSDAKWDPPEIHHEILSHDEMRYIMEKADQSFVRSGVVGKDSPDDARTSETAWIPKSDPVARKVLQRACELTGKPFENAEDLQVVRYKPGTFYHAHHDSCCDDSNSCSKFEKDGGQRVGTLLVYLNNDFTEGHTHFPDHGDKKFKPPPGSGVFFRPLAADEPKCHPKARHAGLPIESGTKYVCNAWIRENKFRCE